MNPRTQQRLKKGEKFVHRIIPAYQIMDQVQGGDYIQDYVNEILLVIEEDIQNAIDSPDKKRYSVTEIQTMFDVPDMANKDAQRSVYYYLIRALKKAEYFPTIEFDKSKRNNPRVFMHVGWFSKEDIEAEKYMDSYILKNSTIVKKVKDDKP